MSSVKIELNSEGVRQLLKSPEMMAICQELANGVARRCGDGYKTSAYRGANRVNVSVVATTKKAIKDNRKNNTILHALGGGTE